MPLAINKRARYDYTILDTFTAGIVLSGPEVKSVKAGHINLKGSFASIDHDEVWLKNAYIAPYAPAKTHQTDYDPQRPRKLLLNRREINSLIGKTAEKGVTLVPLAVLVKKRRVKVELGLGRGKQSKDKRETIKKRDFERRKQRLVSR